MNLNPMSIMAINHTPLLNMTMVDNASRDSAVGFSWPSSSMKYMRSNGWRHDLVEIRARAVRGAREREGEQVGGEDERARG